MQKLLTFILNDLLTQPEILLGLFVAVGYILLKKPAVKVITGTVSAMVGVSMVLFGGSQFSSTFKPIATAVSEAHGIQGYLMDPYAMKAFTQEALGQKFALVGYVFLIAFAINLVLAMLGKYTKVKGIFMTGHTGIAHSQAVLWLVIYWLGLNDMASVVISGVLVGLYWAYSTTLATDPVNQITNNAGFTIGHNQTLGIWFFSKIAKIFGDPEKENIESYNFPGWLSIFNHNVTAIALIMITFVGGFLLTIGIENVQKLAGDIHWITYIIFIGIKFSMYMTILLTGVRMMIGELNDAFKGIQEKLIPDAVPAIDVAALLAFSPNAATLGFITCTIGTVLAMFILYISGSPYMVLPGFVPLFFAGGPIGVVANKFGGYKAVIVCGLLLGFIHCFGTIWMIPLLGAKDAIGWTGMFDWATFWPAVAMALREIAKIFSMGPFA